MAQFIGIAGEFQTEKAINRRLNAVMALYIALTAVIFILGWLTGFVHGRRNLLSLLGLIGAIGIAIPSFRVMGRLFDKQIRRSRHEADGADGELEMIPFLKNLPDTYTVVCDLDFADSYGNIDHLVIGPTGLFAIDAKKWKGIVSADGAGELLLNGKPTDKPQVRYFTRRTMELKDRLKALTGLDPYVQCLFVFPHTHIQAKWGSTGFVHCIHADRLASYITEYRPYRPPAAVDLPRLVKAAESLKNLAPSQPAKKGITSNTADEDSRQKVPAAAPPPDVATDITFSCTGCGQHMVIDASGAGMAVTCPTCNRGLLVPTHASAH